MGRMQEAHPAETNDAERQNFGLGFWVLADRFSVLGVRIFVCRLHSLVLTSFPWVTVYRLPATFYTKTRCFFCCSSYCSRAAWTLACSETSATGTSHQLSKPGT